MPPLPAPERPESTVVVTLTRNRTRLLDRAIRSVRCQDAAEDIEHLIVVDDCRETHDFLRDHDALPANLRWITVSRVPGEVSGPGRSSRLRNLAVRSSRADWVAFLDDDNEWMPGHISDLLRCVRRTGVRAAHSWLRMLHEDGAEYLTECDPWCRDPVAGRAEYARMAELGVVTPGSCVRRDRLDPLEVADPVISVDTSEWLLARRLLLEMPFTDRFDETDAAGLVGEDDKLAGALRANREPVECSGAATLRYYLGGYSNRFDAPFDETFSWTG